MEIIYREIDADSKGFGRGVTAVSEVSARVVSENLSALSAELGTIFADLRSSSASLDLEGMDVTVELSGSGSVRLVASVETELKGGITLRFRTRT